MKERILQPLKDQLGIDLNSIVELCDQYFQANKQSYHQIVEAEKYILELQQKANTQQVQIQQQQQTTNYLRAQFNTWEINVNNFCQKVVQEVIIFYFTNRQHLVNLVMLLNINQNERVFSIGRDLLRKPNAVMNIIKSLTRNVGWQREFQLLLQVEKSQQVSNNIYNEQICLLQSLFAFWSSNQAKREEQEAFLEFMNLTSFIGQMGQHINEEASQTLLRSDIKFLSQLTSIAMLGLGLQNPQYFGQMTVDASQITSASSFLFLPMAVLTKQVPKYADKLNQLAVIEEFKEVMNWTLKSNYLPKSQVVGLLKNQLNTLYEFEMRTNKGDEEKQEQVQQIQQVGLFLLEEKSAIANVWKEGIQTLKIYNDIFNDPLENFECLLIILKKLCGSQQEPHAGKVMDFIQQKNLWPEIFGWVTIKLQQLTEQNFDEKEYPCLICANTIITKMIKQNHKHFEILNQIYTKTAEDCFQGKTNLRFDPSRSVVKRPTFSASQLSRSQNTGTQFEGGEYPLVSFLVKSLHTFLMLPESDGDKPICNLIDALTKLYKKYQVTQRPIMDLICYTLQWQHGVPQLIDWLADFRLFKPQQLISFFKFIRVAFNQQDPFSSISENYIYVQNSNFLCIALDQVYSPTVNNYQKIRFQNEKEKSEFSKELFSLTLVLLSKFDQIKNDGQKVLIAQQTPYFDFLLHVLSQVLNPPQVLQMCLEAIQIVQSRLLGNKTGFLNKIQNDLGGENQSRHFLKMILCAIQVLNQMLDLAKTSLSIKQMRDPISLQSSYIVNIQSIWDLLQWVCDQSQLRMQDQTLITIPALLTYYVLPAGKLAHHHPIRIEALKFLKSTLQIQTNKNTFATLKQTFDQNLPQQLSFFNCIKQEGSVRLSVAYLDFWIQAVQTHGKVAEELLQAKDSVLLIETLQQPFNGAFMHFKNALKHKICILLSLMSTKRCCKNILDLDNQSIAQKVFQFVIEPLLKEMASSKIVFNGDVLNLAAQSIDVVVIEIVSSLNAKITLFYFVKLLQSEFERVPSSKTIRQLIQKLYSNKQFQAIAIDQNFDDQCQELFGIVKNVNENFLRDSASRSEYNYQRLQALTSDNDIVNRLVDGEKSLLFTGDGSVYFSNLQFKDQLEQFEKTALCDYYNSVLEVQSSNGMFGAQFVIDVSELKQMLRQANYDTQLSIHACGILQEYNLALSTVAVNCLLLKAKADFILSVGQTQMQMAIQNQVPLELILTASLLPLISGDELYPQQKHKVLNEILQLLDWSINQIKILHQVIDRNQQVQNAFLTRNLEAQIQMLMVHLGTVGHIVAALKSQHNQLPLEIPSIMNSLLSSLPSNDLFKKDDKETYVLFCQLLTLILQIQQALNQKCQTSTILQSLGLVITGMQRGYCLTEGIQIFILISDMIDTVTFVNLMNRQTEGSLIQVIIQRINDSKISSEEMQLILTLLQSFARSEEGSQNLNKHKVLNYLIKSQSFKLLDQQSPYVTTNNEQNRNHIHTWWLQVLSLIKQMNANLIRDPWVSDSAYFKDLNMIVKNLQYRFQQVLQVNIIPLEKNPIAISIAILEETQLICQILSQMFQHADFWFELDKDTYLEMKDLMLFAVPKVFTNCLQMKTLNPSSLTERQLLGITAGNQDHNIPQSIVSYQNQRTGLQLKMEMNLVMSIMACTASLHNIVTFQKQSPQNNMIQTWGRIEKTNQPSFERTYLDQQVKEPFMQFAFENLLKAMQSLKELHQSLRAPQNQVKKLTEELSIVFLQDLWVQSEYKGGLASILIEESFEELIENIEVTLAMGLYVLSGLLEHISNVLSGVIGFTGDSAQNYQFGYGGGMYDTDQGHGQIEERNLKAMAKKLKFAAKQLVDTAQSGHTSWADEKYLQKILVYADSLIKNPTGTMYYN